jgi:cytochrome c oxidase subunit 3
MSSSVLALPKIEEVRAGGPGGGPPAPPPGDGGGDSFAHRRSAASHTGILLGLAAIVMFFLALTSAFLVRQGTSDDWVSLRLPGVVYANTIALLASSACVEIARRRRKQGPIGTFRAPWRAGTLLGALFLAGQIVAWRQLGAAGIYLASNPSASFFYILTAAHGVHLVGGLLALAWTGRSGGRSVLAVDITTIYWHFMGGLWIYLLLLLRLGG